MEGRRPSAYYIICSLSFQTVSQEEGRKSSRSGNRCHSRKDSERFAAHSIEKGKAHEHIIIKFTVILPCCNNLGPQLCLNVLVKGQLVENSAESQCRCIVTSEDECAE